VSCHNNTMTASTVAMARAAGFKVDEETAHRQRSRIEDYLGDWRERVLQAEGIPGDHDTMSAILMALGDAQVTSSASTDATIHFVLRQQQADGRWPIFAHRPPLATSDIESTAVSTRAVQLYAAPNDRAKANAAIEKGATWLAAATPDSTQEKFYQILGLRWAGGHDAVVAATARSLAAAQREDGGWAQLSTRDSDAFATGEAIVALLRSGVFTPKDPAIARGVQFLMKTQAADGSWHVATRAIPIQPYFDAGFPYGKDQFISAAATNWATQALILATGTSGRTTSGERFPAPAR